MRIYGIGTDIVEIDRIKRLVKNKILLKRLFDTKEIMKCLKVKILQTVLQKDLLQKKPFLKRQEQAYQKVQLQRRYYFKPKNRKPYIKLLRKTASTVKKIKKYKIALSLSDEKNTNCICNYFSMKKVRF